MPTIDNLRAAYEVLKDRAPTEVAAPGKLASGAATEIALLADPRRTAPKRHRRILLPALVAAAVVVTVGAGVTVAANSGSSHRVQNAASGPSTPTAASTPTATPTTASSYSQLPATGSVFSVGKLPDGLRASGGITSPYMEQMTLDSSDGKLAGVIAVVTADQWHPAIPADAVKVKIGGQTGYYGTLNFDSAFGSEDSWFLANATFLTVGDADEPGVLWQDPSGLWAYITGVTNIGKIKQAATISNFSTTVPVPTGTGLPLSATGAAGAPAPTGGPARSTSPVDIGTTADPYGTSTTSGPRAGLPTAALSQSQAVAVANAIHIGTPTVAKVPIKLGYVPAGFSADDTVNLADSALASINKNHFVGGITIVNPDATNPIYNTLYIGVSSGSIAQGVSVADKDQPAVENPKMTTIAIAGYTGSYSPDNSLVVLRNGTVSLSIGDSDGPSAGVPLAELTKIVQSITLASNLGDQSTWFDADKAFA